MVVQADRFPYSITCFEVIFMSKAHDVQKDVVKRHRRELWSKFVQAVQKYGLIEEGDRIAVAMSGGKDSLLLAVMMKELLRHPLVGFEAVFIVMDPGYDREHLERIEKNASDLDIDIVMEPKRVFEVVQERAPDSPCFLCARIRRGVLYTLAEKHGCNKLALGHHFDDVVETTLLNLFYSGTFKTMLPKVASKNYAGMHLIRPLYFVRENEIEKLMRRHGLETLDCACPLGEEQNDSKREEMKRILSDLKRENKDVEKCVFRAADNVNLDYVLGWEKNGRKRRFDDE